MNSLRNLITSGLLICIILELFFNRISAGPVSTAIRSGTGPLTTYERYLPIAIAGDPDIQHFLGYMFFFGEGVELNYESSHYWFHLAAEEGDVKAQRNLGIFHSRAIPRIPDNYYDAGEANLWFSLAAANSSNHEISTTASKFYSRFLYPDAVKLQSAMETEAVGEAVYVSFCAGCHGFNGHAAYIDTPSFALGERLKQDDDTLVNSILTGAGSMPAWKDTLTKEATRKTVTYIRKLFHDEAPDTLMSDSQSSITQHTAQSRSDRAGIEQVYQNFCAGCHGFNGIAWYVNSPSFALRERLEKQDTELAYSIKNGLGEMPSWEYMLKPRQIDKLVEYIRTLSGRYESGIVNDLHQAPQQYFRFLRSESVKNPPGSSNLSSQY